MSIPTYSFVAYSNTGKTTFLEKLIPELNGGIYMFDCKKLFSVLSRITPSPVTGEYYLTDVPKLMIAEGYKVEAFILPDETELAGVNTEEDLKEVERILKKEQM